MGKWGVVGGLLTQQWDFAGSGDADINLTALNFFYAFPLGIGLAKSSIIKGRPWKFQLQCWNDVGSNDVFAPKHLVRFAINPVVSAPWNEGR